MASMLVEKLAEAFVHDVRDAQLRALARHWNPSPARDTPQPYRELMAALDEKEKGLLWDLAGSSLTAAINSLLGFIDHKHVRKELRIILRDLQTGREEVFLDDASLDLPNDYWLEWKPRYAKVGSERPLALEDAAPEEPMQDLPSGEKALVQWEQLLARCRCVEPLAIRFIEQVRDEALTNEKPNMFGTWAAPQNNSSFEGLVARLNEQQRDVVWKLMVETVDGALGRTLRFVDRRLAAGEMKLSVADPERGEQAILSEPCNFMAVLPLLLDKHAQLTQRPMRIRGYVPLEKVPQGVLDALARDFPGVAVHSQEREISSSGDPPPVYLFLLGRKTEMVIYRADGTRVP